MNSENCQKCLRPIAIADAATNQWNSVCRCDHTYSPNAQYSIEQCMKCKKRVFKNATKKVTSIDLCSCEQPASVTIPTFLKQNQQSEIALELSSIGMSPSEFPMERYKPLGVLGVNAGANVILCRDQLSGKKVAVKYFKGSTGAFLAAFTQEVKNNSRLSHPLIAKIIDSGIYNNRAPYVVTEYKEGFNLQHYLDTFGTPTHDVAVKVLMSVCEAIIYAHKEKVFHRNLKPGNVIFIDDTNSEPSIAIMDFGFPSLAKLELTAPADAFFMSADDARGLDFSEKSELYSIGCLGFALLTGRPPFQDGTARDIKNSHALKLPPKISDLKFQSERPKDLEEVVEKCLEKDPRDRFETVAKLLERLEVFPKRVQLQIATLAAARKKQLLIRIAAGLFVLVLVAFLVALFLTGH